MVWFLILKIKNLTPLPFTPPKKFPVHPPPPGNLNPLSCSSPDPTPIGWPRPQSLNAPVAWNPLNARIPKPELLTTEANCSPIIWEKFARLELVMLHFCTLLELSHLFIVLNCDNYAFFTEFSKHVFSSQYWYTDLLRAQANVVRSVFKVFS